MLGRGSRTSTLIALVAGTALFWAVAARAATKEGGAEAALTRVTHEWKALSADAKKRQFRDRWENIIGRLERIGHSKGSVATRALALIRAGAAAEEMHEISRLPKDLRHAEALYREASKLKTPSANEALAKANALSVPKPAKVDETPKKVATPEPAKVVEAPKSAPSADPQELVAATHAWRKLKQDAEKRTQRAAWLPVVRDLEAVGDKFAPEQPGALGYFRAARAAEDLYKLSKKPEDVARTIRLFELVAEKCPKTFLNDDALIAAAEIEWTSLHDADAARAHLTKALALEGDSGDEARQLLAKLPAVDEKPAAPAVAQADATDDANDDVEEEEAPAPVAKAPEKPAKPVETEKVADVSAPELKRIRKALLADTEMSLSEEVGLKVKRIVIDAGHGGKDQGASGPSGVHEKDVTLGIARKLAATLKARGYEVVLTRDSDDYVALEDRAEIANRERGDLFISIHANAHPSKKQSGIETYSLNVASNRFAKRLAARENSTSNRTVSDVQYLLADLATRSNTIDSDRLATRVQSSLIDGVAKKFTKPKDHGVKHALFYVLLGAKMPAVLVETAFLSNPTEEKRLASVTYQQIVAESIARGVEQFVDRRKQLASVDP